MLARVHLVVLTALLCWLPSPALAQRGEWTKNDPRVLAAFRSVVAPVHQSVVQVLSNGKESALGTIVGADGWILTKASLLKGKPEVKLADGKTFPAEVIGFKEDHDLAMLKIAAKGLPAVR